MTIADDLPTSAGYVDAVPPSASIAARVYPRPPPARTALPALRRGRKLEIDRKLYPGYVFIQMCLYGEDKKVINKPWYFVKEVAGVIGFVGGDAPAALRQSEIDEIRARIEAANGKEVPKVQYAVGEEVKITDGAFTNLTGRIDEIDPERGKLKISVSIFGRFTPVELEYWQVQRITE